MANSIKDILKRILDYFKEMTRGQRIRFFSLIAMAVIIIVVAASILTKKEYAVLYAGMNPQDAGDVMLKLQSMNIDAVAQGSGTVLVEKSKADEVRMTLAAEGYPQSGFNFDIFEKASGLGVTDMQRKVYYQYQLQEHIRKTIEKMEKIASANVLLTIPDDSMTVLPRDKKPATASVMLELKSGRTLETEEARTVAELVAKSVSGLEVEDVSVMDTEMNQYSTKVDDSDYSIGSQLSLKQTVQKNFQQQVMNLLNPVFGSDRVRAEVNVVLNFDTIVIEEKVVTPPNEGSDRGIIVSMEELMEIVKENTEGDVAGIDPNGAAPQYPDVDIDENATYTTISRKANYEINETKKMIEKAKGDITDLSVSIVLDSSEESIGVEEYVDRVKNLVATAIGIDEDRVSVNPLPFIKMAEGEVTDAIKQQREIVQQIQNAELLQQILWIAAGLAGLIILFVLIMKVTRPKQAEYAMEGGGISLMADEDLSIEAIEGVMQPGIIEKEDTNLSQLEDYVNKSPESVAQLLRNWLSSDDFGR